MLALAWNANVGIPLLIVGAIVLALIWLFGQPKKEQGRRRAPRRARHAASGVSRPWARPALPTIRSSPRWIATTRRRHARRRPAAAKPEQGELDMGLREELEKLGATLAGERSRPHRRRADTEAQAVEPGGIDHRGAARRPASSTRRCRRRRQPPTPATPRRARTAAARRIPTWASARRNCRWSGSSRCSWWRAKGSFSMART